MKQYVVVALNGDAEVEGVYGPYGADTVDMVRNYMKNGLGWEPEQYDIQELKPIADIVDLA